MQQFLESAFFLVCAILGALLYLAVAFAILRMDVTTRATLQELQKVSAALLLVHDLVEGPAVKGKPRIVRARNHHPPAMPA